MIKMDKNKKVLDEYEIANIIAEIKMNLIINSSEISDVEFKRVKSLILDYISNIHKNKIPTPSLQRFFILWNSLKLVIEKNHPESDNIKRLLTPIFMDAFELQLKFYSNSSPYKFLYFVINLTPEDNSFTIEHEWIAFAHEILKSRKELYFQEMLKALEKSIKFKGSDEITGLFSEMEKSSIVSKIPLKWKNSLERLRNITSSLLVKELSNVKKIKPPSTDVQHKSKAPSTMGKKAA